MWNAIQQKGTKFLIKEWFLLKDLNSQVSERLSLLMASTSSQSWDKDYHMAGDCAEGM